MSFISSSPLKLVKPSTSTLNPLRDGNPMEKNPTNMVFVVGENSQNLKANSPRKSNSSLTERESYRSPLKTANLSPVANNEDESVYSSHPNQYFTYSPDQRVVATDAAKTGSGKKSKYSLNRSYDEDQKHGLVLSSKKRDYSFSPGKENILRGSPNIRNDVHAHILNDTNNVDVESRNEKGDNLEEERPNVLINPHLISVEDEQQVAKSECAAEGAESASESKNLDQSSISLRADTKPHETRRDDKKIDNSVVLPENKATRSDILQDLANQTVKELRRNREKFEDTLFPPNMSSLVNSTRHNKRPEWSNFEWVRLAEIYRHCKLTLCEEITPLSISPGLLKNYNFLSVLAALSEHPEINQSFNYEGCYSVQVCRDGLWRSVMVDDFVPCIKEGSKGPYVAAFLRTASADKKLDIWQPIFEKAWAKVFDTYENFEQTSLSHMLRDTVGAPCQTHSIIDLQQTWDLLYNCFPQGDIIVASINGQCSQFSAENLYRKGFNASYANTVLNISSTEDVPLAERVIKIRNIWNDEHTWQSGNILNKERVAEKKINIMSLQEFCSIFTHIHACSYRENFVNRSTTMRHVHQAYSIVKFKSSASMQCYFDCIQVDERFLRGDPNYRYSNSRLLLFKSGKDKQTFVKGSFSTEKYNTLKVDLIEGSYYLVGMIDWKNNIYDFNISAYAENELSFERVHYRDNPNLLSELLQDYMTDQTVPKSLVKSMEFLKYERSSNELQMNIEMFINRSSTKTLNVQKRIIKTENANLLNMSLSEKNLTAFTVPPGSSKVLVVGKEDPFKDLVYQCEDSTY